VNNCNPFVVVGSFSRKAAPYLECFSFFSALAIFCRLFDFLCPLKLGIVLSSLAVGLSITDQKYLSIRCVLFFTWFRAVLHAG